MREKSTTETLVCSSPADWLQGSAAEFLHGNKPNASTHANYITSDWVQLNSSSSTYIHSL